MKIDRNRLKDRIKYIVKGMAIVALVVILVIVITSCGKKNGGQEATHTSEPATVISTSDVTPTATAEPTEIPTEAPTPTPEPTATPEPTPTPLPDDWVTDPRGIIPTDVHIYAQDDVYNGYAHCITINGNGDTVCQRWSKSDGLLEEIIVPDMFLSSDIEYIRARTDGEEKVIFGFRDDINEMLFFYQINGHYFCVDTTSSILSGVDCFLATKDGKLIWYTFRTTSYKCHDFGTGKNVIINESCRVYVDGVGQEENVEDMDYTIVDF